MRPVSCQRKVDVKSEPGLIMVSPVILFVIGGQHDRGDVTIAYCCHLYADI
jgi:hypothetical protein